jgi:integrase
VGKLYRRKGTPYYWARWHDAQGVLRRESTRSSDRRVASLFLSAREADTIKEAAGLPVAKRIALADAVGEYLDAHPPPIWSQRWHYTVAHWFRSRLLPALGSERGVGLVGRDDVERARSGWLSEGLRPPTVNRLCAVGSGFFRWARDPARRYCLDNPFATFSRFAEVKAKPPPVTEAQLQAFLTAIPNASIRRAAIVALDTGLRLSEVRRIRPADVHGRELHVQSSYERGLTKNTRERWVLLTARAKAAIEEQGEGGFASLPVNVRKSLHRAQRTAGLARFRWHDLRHYALTRAANAGTQAHHLRGMAGWSGDESGRYIHPEAEGMRAFVESVDRQCAPVEPESCSTEKNAGESGDTPGKDS